MEHISFSVEQGTILGLLGENGAGKTTLAKLISGILSPTEGVIRVLGHDPFHRENAFKKKISLVFGDKRQLLWDLPPVESFYVTGYIYDLSRAQIQDQITRLSDLFQVNEFLHIPVRNLSLGQRMRCELINSLLHSPQLILLDEPTLGLDLKTQAIVRSYLCDYVKDTGATCIVTSHYLRDIVDMAESIVVLNKGHKVLEESLSHFFEKYNSFDWIQIAEEHLQTEQVSTLLRNYEININQKTGRLRVLKKDTASVMILLMKQYSPEVLSVQQPSVEELLEIYMVNLAEQGEVYQ